MRPAPLPSLGNFCRKRSIVYEVGVLQKLSKCSSAVKNSSIKVVAAMCHRYLRPGASNGIPDEQYDLQARELAIDRGDDFFSEHAVARRDLSGKQVALISEQCNVSLEIQTLQLARFTKKGVVSVVPSAADGRSLREPPR